MAEPVSLAAMKAHLRVVADETDEDDTIASLIVAARRACENVVNRTIVGRLETLSLDAFPAPPPWPAPASRDARTIFLPGGTTAAVTGVTYRDAAGATVTIAPSAYTVDLVWKPARIDPVDAWPVASGQVRVAYTLATMAADDLSVAAQAIKLLVGHWYTNRETVVTGTIASELPMAVGWLLAPLRQFAND